MPRKQCQYGEKCYQKAPEHKEQFAHPGDADYEEMAGYQATDVPLAPYVEGESVEDKGLLGAAGGAAAVAAGLGGAKMMGAFGGKGEKPGFVKKHPVLAAAGAVAAIGVGAFAGHKIQDGVSGKKKKSGGKKDKKTKSRGLEVGERGLDLDEEDSDSDTDSSSEEEAAEEQQEEKK